MLHIKFQGHRHFGSEEEFFNVYHIWAWRLYWSYDLNHLNKLLCPYLMEAPHEIWLRSAMRFLRKRRLKMLNLSDLDQGQ